MSIHDHLMSHGASDVLLAQLGEPEALELPGLGNSVDEPLRVDAIVAAESSQTDFDPLEMEYTERITRLVHIPLTELTRAGLSTIPPRSVAILQGRHYATRPARTSGAMLTVELERKELVRQFTGESHGPV